MASERVEQLQASVRALSVMGLTYEEISELERVSRDTIATWGKGTSRAHGALPVTKIGATARIVNRLVCTLADIRSARMPGWAARVTIRRTASTPDWAVRLTTGIAQGWLVREAIYPPADGESYLGLPPTPTLETRPGGVTPETAVAYRATRGSYPVGAAFKMAESLHLPPSYRHVVIDVPNLLLWAKFRPNDVGLGEYPWRPDTTGE